MVTLLLAALLAGDARVGAGVRERIAAAESVRVVVRVDGEVELPLTDLRRLPRASLVRGHVRAADLDRLLAHPGVVRIDLDPPAVLHLAEALPQVNVPPVHQLGLVGEGATVAIIDTGVWADHPDLAGAVVDEACFCGGGCCYNGEDTDFGPGAADDATGHGTHVAGVVASSGGQAALGSAPATRIVAIKVFDENEDSCCTSDMIAALEWILTDQPEVDVVNMSLGSGDTFADICDGSTAWTEAYAQVIEQLWARGTLVIASSGNNQSGVVMPAPACLSRVVSVGAVWDREGGPFGPFGGGCVEWLAEVDKPACFGNSNALTDLMAPGAIITSTDLRAGGTRPRVGTSHAAPFAAGCAALIKGLLPELDAAAVRAALAVSDVRVTDEKNGLTFPRLDCYAALLSVADEDGDAVIDRDDNCPAVGNVEQEDADDDGAGDPCDSCPLDASDDADADGVCEDVDDCPGLHNPDQQDRDGDGAGDSCDGCPLDASDDADGDGTCEDVDNCPGLFNHYQEDSDGDGIGDACDLDTVLPRPPVPDRGCAAVPASPLVVGLLWFRRRRH